MAFTRSRSSNPPQASARQGNLAGVLTSYDHKNKTQSISSQPHASSNGSSLSINVPDKAASSGNNTNQDADDDRERSLTLGSEFDLGYIMGKDGRGMSISGLLTPLGEAVLDGTISEGTHTTAVTSSTSSTQHAAGGGGAVHQHLSQVPEHASSSAPIPTPAANNNTHRHNTRSRGDSTASFLNGLYQDQQQQSSVSTRSHGKKNNNMIAHTPPTGLGASYENNRFGKRIRSGSISGRLRSASDLEDTGVISREQKAILKDLLIAGDSNVQSAIDKYESGDAGALEQMIKSGALLAGRSSDVDLLGDLDLDFLNVHGGADDSMFGGNVEDLIGNSNNSKPPAAAAPAGDGIGDLEFNEDPAAVDVEPTPVEAAGNSSQQVHYNRARGYSKDDIEVHRMRANSLAVPGMLLDGADPDNVTSVSFERWMDTHIGDGGQQQQGGIAPQHYHQQQHPSNDANGIQNILNASQFSSDVDVLMGGKSRQGKALGEKPASPDKKSKPKKERKKYTKKDKTTEPRERKSQSKMKDMMEIMNNPGGGVGGDHEEPKIVPSGLGRPRSMSDPNLSVRLDDHGLLHVDGPEGWVGAYSPNSRHLRVNRFLEKRAQRVWSKKVKYGVRKNFADSRLRVKGRFVKKEDEMIMRELMSLT